LEIRPGDPEGNYYNQKRQAYTCLFCFPWRSYVNLSESEVSRLRTPVIGFRSFGRLPVPEGCPRHQRRQLEQYIYESIIKRLLSLSIFCFVFRVSCFSFTALYSLFSNLFILFFFTSGNSGRNNMPRPGIGFFPPSARKSGRVCRLPHCPSGGYNHPAFQTGQFHRCVHPFLSPPGRCP
jgi:hypothetical protein